MPGAERRMRSSNLRIISVAALLLTLRLFLHALNRIWRSNGKSIGSRTLSSM